MVTVQDDPQALLVSRRAERWLVPATFVTTMGNALQITATAILVFRAQHTALAVGWLFIAVAIPQMLLSLGFGRLADRVDRRMLCVVADLASAVIALGLPVWLWLGGPTDIGSYAASFLLACVSALFVPASSALIKERIRDQRLPQFNAHYEMATNAGMLLAASMAGFMVQLFGATPLFVVNTLTFLASAVCTVKIGPRLAGTAATGPDAPGEDAGRRPVEAREPATGPVLRLGIMYGSGQVAIVVSNALLTVLILQGFRAGPGFVGLVDALAGIGFLVGAATFRFSSPRISLPRLALAGYLAACASLLLHPLALWALMAVIPFSTLLFCQGRVATRTMLMRAVPESRSGRVFGATQAFGLAYAVSATIGLSALADHTSITYGYDGMALLVAVSVAAAGLPLALGARGGSTPAVEPVTAAPVEPAVEPVVDEPTLPEVATVALPVGRTGLPDERAAPDGGRSLA